MTRYHFSSLFMLLFQFVVSFPFFTIDLHLSHISKLKSIFSRYFSWISLSQFMCLIYFSGFFFLKHDSIYSTNMGKYLLFSRPWGKICEQNSKSACPGRDYTWWKRQTICNMWTLSNGSGNKNEVGKKVPSRWVETTLLRRWHLRKDLKEMK